MSKGRGKKIERSQEYIRQSKTYLEENKAKTSINKARVFFGHRSV